MTSDDPNPFHLFSQINELTMIPILIKNGTIVNASETLNADVLIENGKIVKISKNIQPTENLLTIVAEGLLLLPGGIDPHTHFEFEFMGTTSADDFYHGTKAAIAGGTTTIIDFAFPKPKQSILQCFEEYRKKADGKVCCDYALHMCLIDWSEEIKEELSQLVTKGVNSFKMFMAYDFRFNDIQLYEAFEEISKLKSLPMVHAENGSVIAKNAKKLLLKGIKGPEGHEQSRPEEVEAEATGRACMIAKQVDSPLYVVHVMSKSAAEAIDNSRKFGCKVIGETLVAALAKDGSSCKHSCFHHSAGHVLSPPLRSDPTTPVELAKHLSNNVLQTTGSDNCTFNKSQKELGKGDFTKIPNGVNGVEDRMSVIWEKGVHSGLFSPNRFVEVTSTNAAKIFNLFPKKGIIAEGSDADIVIWNPSATRIISAKTHNHAVDFNIFEGMEVHGVAEYVLVKGSVCVSNRKVKEIRGLGEFIPTPPDCPYVYNKEKAIFNNL